MAWSSKQYRIFENERTRPVRDLLSAIPKQDAQIVVDIGCGPGNSTEELAAKFPQASIIGVDNSLDMIAAARQRLPHIQFEAIDIETWDTSESFDIILANAVLQWLPHHDHLFPKLIHKLNLNGVLAIQMPDNHDEPSHQLMRKVASEKPWAAKLATAIRPKRENANWYYELLQPHCTQIELWRTTYYHPLTGGINDIVEWFKGSSLRPFLALLDENEQTSFLNSYTSALKKAYPTLANGTVLLPFPRLFIVAIR